MKRLMRLVASCLAILGFFGANSVYAASIFELKDATIIQKSDAVEVEILGIDGNTVNGNAVFHGLGDSASYDISLENTSSEKIVIKDLRADGENEFLDYSFGDYEEMAVAAGESFDILLMVSYASKNEDIAARMQALSISVTIIFETESGEEGSSEIIINPSTGDDLAVKVLLLVASVTGLMIAIVLVRKNEFRMRVSGAVVLVLALAGACGFGVLVFASEDDGDVIISAEYALMDKLVVNYNDGVEDKTVIVDYGDTLDLQYEREGWSFDGWMLENGSDFDPTEPIVDDITIVPKAHIISRAIIYNANGGDGQMESTALDYGQTVEVKASAFTKENKSFSYWTTEPDGGQIIQRGTELAYSDFDGTDDVTLYAQWVDATTQLTTGQLFRAAAFRLDGDASTSQSSTIESIEMAEEPSIDVLSRAEIVSVEGSTPVYMWGSADGKNIQLFSYATDIQANPNMANTCQSMKKLNDASFFADVDMSTTTDVSRFFASDTVFDDLDSLANWDVSNVENFSYIFSANAFTDVMPLAHWNISSATNITGIFSDTKLANVDGLKRKQHDGDDYISWDTSNVMNFTAVFTNANLSDISPLAGWITSNATLMPRMFSRNRNISSLTALKDWDVSHVTNMEEMFLMGYPSNDYDSPAALRSLDGLQEWVISSVTDMDGIFEGADLRDISAITDWQTGAVRYAERVFFGNENLSEFGAVAGWNTANFEDISYFFANTAVADADDVLGWNTAKVKDVQGLYEYTSISDISGLRNWNVGNVTRMENLFREVSTLANLDGLANWRPKKLQKISYGFYKMSALTDISGLSGWVVNSLNEANCAFEGTRIANLNALAGWNPKTTINMNSAFADIPTLTDISGLSGWSNSKPTYMNNLFKGSSNIESIAAMASINITKVIQMDNVFEGLNKITDLSPLANWKFDSADYVGYMFKNCSSLTDVSPLAGWRFPKVTFAYYMFTGTGITDFSSLEGWIFPEGTNKKIVFGGLPAGVILPSWGQ